ncbi:MAG: hypothetical protein AAB380_08545 [Verrucomicrobiota bacterium]
MKKFAFIFGLVLLAAILVAAGFWFGFSQRFMTDAWSSTVVDKSLTDATVKALILHHLDSGKIDDARHLLQTQLDGDILLVDSLLDYSDARSRELAGKIFARIAAYRAEYPSNYVTKMPEIDTRVDSILKRASESHK